MGKRRLGDLAREVRLFAAPIPETRPKIVNRRVMNAHAAQRLQIESGDALDAQFREMARPEIEQFKREMIQREGVGANVESISDQELLREVMNTVGKAGRLGESIRCVVSVSMLTEGWDANTVTHISASAPSARNFCASRSSAVPCAGSPTNRMGKALASCSERGCGRGPKL
jgi:hypothetical protein